MSDISELTTCLREFARARDWQPFHSPKNLAISISLEANELLQLFQWEDPEYTPKLRVDAATELADIFIYLLQMADVMNIDLTLATIAKIASNSQRYPIEKAKGNCNKADEL